MQTAQTGDTVKVHYTGKLEDGTVFDTSLEREPLEFPLGQGALIKGFEAGVTGMAAGESKTVSVAPDDGYGQHFAEMVQSVERSAIPAEIELKIGGQLQVMMEDDRPLIVTVTEIGDEHVTLDGNHPLAGKTLIFDIELVEIVG